MGMLVPAFQSFSGKRRGNPGLFILMFRGVARIILCMGANERATMYRNPPWLKLLRFL